MIILDDVWKSYPTRHGRHQVFSEVNLQIAKGEKVGILGRNGAGKSTLVRIIGGAEQPTRGKVIRNMTVSWPLAFSGAFQYSLTGYDNLRFICRVYGVDPEEKVDAVQSFSELGKFLWEPLRTYSSGMRARLGFAVSMAIEFDCFLIDEVTAVGDARFRDRCYEELNVKRADRAMIMVSHNAGYVRENCTKAGVLTGGRLTMFDDVDEAYEFYMAHAGDD
ncbi:capsular polysaccharide transport system ATP-binding protein [Sphingobium sp. AP50]|uniref:ABC transporter ATP-binding protein n=1 Tax=Sphingobium sp. AP50 TaxID=1884369 RepID=UPI0008B1D7CE|nr:ABC transporter ATP-binding protein [Sphingobium sp. AP50]SEJ78771.1 capsular polysaccharide transport system ATP-binding protein [Sphingobium sp. AP50]